MSAAPDPPGSFGDVPWESAIEAEADVPAEASPSAWGAAASLLTPIRLRVLALVSLLATGTVVWAASGGARAGDAAAAAALLQQRRVVLARPATTASADATPAPASAPAVTPTPTAAHGPTPSPSPSPSPAPAAAATPAAAGAPASGGAPASRAGATGPTGASGPAGTTGATGATAAPKVQTKIGHVFVIVLAGQGYAQTWGAGSAATYLTGQLLPQGTLLTNFYAVAHPELADYIAMVSGQPPNPDTEQNCPTFSEFPPGTTVKLAAPVSGTGCVYPNTVLTIGDQLSATGRAWHAYAEDLANGTPAVRACRHPGSGQADPTAGQPTAGDQYATRHNPFVYFHSLLDLGDCAADDVALTQLPKDLAAVSTTPAYSFIVPNLCDDGSDVPCVDGRPGGLASADAFLSQWVPQILQSPAYRKDGLLVVTFDQGPSSDTSGCCAAPSGGGDVGALVLSRYARPGATSATPYDDYSLLGTVEDLFGLQHLADAALPAVRPFGSDVLPGVLPASAR